MTLKTNTTKIGLQNAIAARRHEIEQLRQENALSSTDAKIAYKNHKIIGLLAKLIDLDSQLLTNCAGSQCCGCPVCA